MPSRLAPAVAVGDTRSKTMTAIPGPARASPADAPAETTETKGSTRLAVIVIAVLVETAIVAKIGTGRTIESETDVGQADAAAQKGATANITGPGETRAGLSLLVEIATPGDIRGVAGDRDHRLVRTQAVLTARPIAKRRSVGVGNGEKGGDGRRRR